MVTVSAAPSHVVFSGAAAPSRQDRRIIATTLLWRRVSSYLAPIGPWDVIAKAVVATRNSLPSPAKAEKHPKGWLRNAIVDHQCFMGSR